MPKGVRIGTTQWNHTGKCLSCYKRNGLKPDTSCTEPKHYAQYGRILIAQRRKQLGLQSGQYERMALVQDRKCAICERSVLENSKIQKNLAVDHNHTTGIIRGLLCEQCNHGLGQFRDSPELLRKAINYLYSSVSN